MEGTGSILIKEIENVKQEEKREDELKYVKITKNNIRFLSPKEIANLHCFPSNFGKIIYLFEET